MGPRVSFSAGAERGDFLLQTAVIVAIRPPASAQKRRPLQPQGGRAHGTEPHPFVGHEPALGRFPAINSSSITAFSFLGWQNEKDRERLGAQLDRLAGRDPEFRGRVVLAIENYLGSRSASVFLCDR
jgi:hypothetical protein